MKNYLFAALTLGMTFFAFMAFQEAKPTTKAPIYKEVQKYSPYYLDKRFGGLQIMNREDEEFKEKPTNMEIFHRFESFEKDWGKVHLSIRGDQVVVRDNNQSEIATIPLQTQEDTQFVHSFYGI